MRSRYFTPLLFVLPWLIAFALFWLFPFLYSLALSFTNYSLLNPGTTEWIGLQNYQRLLQDPNFWLAMKNTTFFCLGTIPVTMALALWMAEGIHQTTRFQKIFRTAVFIPSIVSVTVISLIFIQFYTQNGYLQSLAALLGIVAPDRGILVSEKTALLGIMAMDVFISSGYYAIIFLAGIAAIPVDYYEEASLVGAGAWQKFRHITLPQLRPILLFAVIINTIKSFQVFTEIFMMTKGGPLHSTTTMVYQVYDWGFKDFRMGYASAMAFVLLLILGLCAWLQIRLMRER